jgi:hypothetical protein
MTSHVRSGRIIVVTTWERPVDRRGIQTGGPKRLIASHGIDEDTGRHLPLQNDSPEHLGAVFDPALQEWVIT